MTFSTSANLGDCCFCAMFMRRLPGQHSLFVKPEYVEGLRGMMNDVGHYIGPLSEWQGDGIDVWMANARYEQAGLRYEGQHDIMAFVAGFFNHVAGECGHPCPLLNSPKDLLWDSAAIGPSRIRQKLIDCLIISADPLSGQCPQYSRSELYDQVVIPMTARWGSVVCTNNPDGSSTGFSLVEIGILATMAKRIICVATGASWPVWNVWVDAPTIVILDPMRLDFRDGREVHHAANAAQVREHAERLGWL